MVFLIFVPGLCVCYGLGFHDKCHSRVPSRLCWSSSFVCLAILVKGPVWNLFVCPLRVADPGAVRAPLGQGCLSPALRPLALSVLGTPTNGGAGLFPALSWLSAQWTWDCFPCLLPVAGLLAWDCFPCLEEVSVGIVSLLSRGVSWQRRSACLDGPGVTKASAEAPYLEGPLPGSATALS